MWTKGTPWDTLGLSTDPKIRVFISVGGRFQGWRVGSRGWRDEWDCGTGCEIHKEAIKSRQIKTIQYKTKQKTNFLNLFVLIQTGTIFFSNYIENEQLGVIKNENSPKSHGLSKYLKYFYILSCKILYKFS